MSMQMLKYCTALRDSKLLLVVLTRGTCLNYDSEDGYLSHVMS